MNLRRLTARFHRNERGNVLIMAGMGAFSLVGAAGLATDGTQWFLWKRQIQMAADAGALAGAYTLQQGSSQITTPATREIVRNQTNDVYGVEYIGSPPRSGAHAGDVKAAEVVLTKQQRLPFSGLFLKTPPVIRARAVAAQVRKSDNCLISLATSGIGVRLTGSANIQLGCGVAANSNGSQAIYLEGNSYLDATTLAAVGQIDPKLGSLSPGTDQFPLAPPQTDPYGSQGRNLQVPTTPTECSHRSLVVEPNQSVTLSPGRLCAGVTLKGTVNFQPGVYIVDGGTFNMTSQANVTGSGVTFVMTGIGSDVARLQVDGGATVNLTAPTAAQSATWNGVLFFQDPRGNTNGSTISGTGNMQLNGAVYFPGSHITYTGSSTVAAQCLAIVAHRVTFTGGSRTTNGCPDKVREDLAFRVVRVVE